MYTDREVKKNTIPGYIRQWMRVVLLCLTWPFLSGCLVNPNPITEPDHWQRSRDDQAVIFNTQDLPTGPISLEEAIARAIKYNLDHRLAQMETAFHLKQLDAANLNMLPRLALNAGYSIRNNEAASSSISYKTRQQTLEPSVSSQVNRISGDLAFSWSILDFGLSYFHARQQADRYLILRERRRRIVNNMVKDVIALYFRVATAERIGPQVEDTLRKSEIALETYRKIEEGKSAPLVQTLEHQRSLISIISHLRLISMELASARSNLAALMNLPLDFKYEIAGPGASEMPPPVLAAQLGDLETIGIYLRPDLREEAYQARIDKYEVKKEMLRMVPGLSVFTSGNYDSNKYLVNQMWAEAGARTTLDILGMAARYQQVKAGKVQESITHTRRLAGTIAALVQINMSYYQYRQAVELHADAEKLDSVEAKLLDLSGASAKAREVGALDHIRQTALALNSRLERDRKLIEVFSAWGNLFFSIGGDILSDIEGKEDLSELTRMTKTDLDRWLAGGLPALPSEAPVLENGCIAAASVVSDQAWRQ